MSTQSLDQKPETETLQISHLSHIKSILIDLIGTVKSIQFIETQIKEKGSPGLSKTIADEYLHAEVTNALTKITRAIKSSLPSIFTSLKASLTTPNPLVKNKEISSILQHLDDLQLRVNEDILKGSRTLSRKFKEERYTRKDTNKASEYLDYFIGGLFPHFFVSKFIGNPKSTVLVPYPLGTKKLDTKPPTQLKTAESANPVPDKIQEALSALPTRLYYSSDFSDGLPFELLPNLQGHFEMSSGKFTLIGQLHKGQPEGICRVFYKTGDHYEGEFKGTKKHGFGRFISGAKNPVIYTGRFKDDLKDGTGEIIYTDKGESYVGQFWKDKKNGLGKQVYKSGNIYEGEWIDNLRNGHGKCRYASGSVYEGSWVGNKREGQGRMTWKTKTYYEGSWFNDKRHGTGEIHYVSGALFQGVFEADKRNGFGKLWMASGDYVEAMYKDDARNGKGKYIWNNGDFYIGNFRNSEIYGTGKKIFADGKVQEGEWDRGFFMGKSEPEHFLFN